MLFEKAELEQWKEKCGQDAVFAKAFDALCGQAEKMDAAWLKKRQQEMERVRERALTKGGGKIMRYGNEMRAAAEQLLTLCVFDVLMGWERMDVINGLFDILLRDPWRFQGQFDGWESDLWTADVGVSAAVSWELVQKRLGRERNEQIRRAIHDRGFVPLYREWIDPETRIHALDTMGHNWWSVCVSGAGVMLLVLEEAGAEKEDAGYARLLLQIVQSLREWFFYDGNVGLNKHPNFGAQGDYREYIGYLVFGMAHFSVFMTLLEQSHGADCLQVDEILEKIPDFFLENLLWTQDGRRCADFGDNHLCTTPMHFLYFLCRRFSRRDLLEAVNEMYVPGHVCELLFYPAGLEKKERGLAALAVYENSGHAVLRSGAGKDGLVFIMKNGESWNHNHLDAGTFELAVNQEKLISDSGTCSYSNPLYEAYYVQPWAHNTITFAQKGVWEGARYEGTKYPGRYAAWMEKEDYKYLLADCTGPYAQLLARFYRHVILSGEKIVIVDDVEAYEDGVVEAFFHGNGRMCAEENRVRILTKRQQLCLVFPFADKDAVTMRKGYGHTGGEDSTGRELIEEQPYVSCRYETKNRRVKCVTVILPQKKPEPGGQAALPEVIASAEGEVLEFQIAEGGRREVYLVNLRADGSVMHKNGWISRNGVETDAFLCALFYEEETKLCAYSVHNGSRLRVGGRVLFSDNRKKNCCETLKEQKQ